MTYSVYADNYEITGKLGVVKVDTSGMYAVKVTFMYAVKVTFTDELYAVVKDQNVSDFKICSLYDSELSSGQMRPAFITGLNNTWELFTLNGEKMETFSAKEFLIAGFMDAGTPFSMYIAKFIMAMPSADYMDEGRSGDSWEDAYVIDSVEDFISMRGRSSSEQGKYYKLTADLDLTTESDLSYYFFNGHFDGQNHKITIAITQIDSSCGLFAGVSSDAVAIRNLNVEGSVSGGNVVGGIASHLEAGIIENCSFTGTVASVHTEDDNLVVDAGGIVGDLNNKGIIRNCTFQGTVRASGINDGTAGGIIASTNGGTIENCTVSSGSTIEASRRAGGIAGEVGQHMGDYETQSTYITNCTSYAQLAGNATSKGGIVGEILNDTINYFEGNTWPSEYPQSGSGSTNPDYNPEIPSYESADIPQTVSADLPEGIVQPVILSSDVVENIARTLSIDSSQIQFISQENIAPAEDPSQSMIDYVQADNHEITGKLGVISVDTAGVYVVKVVMTDELYAVLKDQNVANFRIYALSDKDTADVNTSLISGMIGTWEILSLSGEKLTNFGVREFLMVGMLNAGTPFSMYIAKILIALLLGGCNSSINTIWLGVLALIVFAALRFRKR